MGKQIFDKYTLLHIASCVIAKKFGMKENKFHILHLLFEIWENSEQGVEFLSTWEFYDIFGGKTEPDAVINSIGDLIGGYIGYRL